MDRLLAEEENPGKSRENIFILNTNIPLAVIEFNELCA